MEIPIKQILEELATKINWNQTCKFNINRASVLDGAVRGFTRLSYNPNNRMVIKFSDDKGKYEEAIDLGGPRREFLRLLLVALMQSSMFEGKEDSLNLALDSQGIHYIYAVCCTYLRTFILHCIILRIFEVCCIDLCSLILCQPSGRTGIS